LRVKLFSFFKSGIAHAPRQVVPIHVNHYEF
jgi:hypothetical protein